MVRILPSAVVLALLGAHSAGAETNMNLLRQAKVFAICQPGNTEDDVRALRDMGVDVVVRGVHGVWAQSPEQGQQGQESKAALMALSHDLGLCFMTMITSAAIYEKDVPAGKYDAWVTRDALNRTIPVGNWHQGCLNNPEYREYVKSIARAVIDGGADGIHYDESYGKYFWMKPLPCFCDHCCAQFREYLRTKHSAAVLKARFGIEDIGGLNYREYLAARGLGEHPWDSPLHDEWWLFQLDTTTRYEKEIVEDSKAYAASKYGRELVTNANQYHIETLCPVIAAESAIYDNVNIGTGWQIEYRSESPAGSRLRLPPDISFVPMYRMAHAVTPDKPVSMFLDIQEPPAHFSALPADQQGRLLEWLCAEAYAAHCYQALHYRFSLWEGPREELRRIGRFFAEHHDRYYAHTEPEARIGVLYSFASYTWDMYPMYWTGKGRAHCREYYGICQALIDANLQFDTVFLGDGRLFPEEQPTRLRDFDILIAPSAYALTDRNLAALADYVGTGGKLVRSGPLGVVDEENRPRSTLPPELGSGHPGVYGLRGDYEAYLGTKEPGALADLAELLVGKLGEIPTVASRDLAANLQLHVRRSPTRDALLIDVINRDFQPGRGFRPTGETDMLLTLPGDYGMRGKTVRALTPDRGVPEGQVDWVPVTFSVRQPIRPGMPGPMTIGRRATVKLRLPKVDVYTLVVIE